MKASQRQQSSGCIGQGECRFRSCAQNFFGTHNEYMMFGPQPCHDIFWHSRHGWHVPAVDLALLAWRVRLALMPDPDLRLGSSALLQAALRSS